MQQKIKNMIRLTLLLSLFCSLSFGQKVLIIDTDTGKERIRDFPSKTGIIPGLEPNIDVYYILEKQRPTYDRLTENLQRNRRLTDSIADGNNYPYAVYEWSKIPLSEDVINKNKKAQATRTEIDSLTLLMTDYEFKRYVLITLGILIDDSRNNNPTAKQDSILNEVKVYSDKSFEYYDKKEKELDSLQIKKISIR
jgi:hypothetical protein